MHQEASFVLFLLPVLPLAAALLICFFPEKLTKVSGLIALLTNLVILTLTALQDPVILPWHLKSKMSSISASVNFIPDYNLSIRFVLDGFSGWLIIACSLTALTAIAFAMSFSITKNQLFSIMLVLASAIGIFLSRDLVSLLASWGLWLILPFSVTPRQENQRRTAGYIKFFIFHLLSFLLVVAGLSIVYFQGFQGGISHSLQLETLMQVSLSSEIQKLVLLLLFAGFAIRMPLFPFHGWLSDSLDEMPSSLAAVLTSTGLASGTYAIIIFCLPLCPDIAIQMNRYFIFLAMVSMIYGAMVALVNPHILQRLAFICLGYSGFLLLGIFSLNNTGLEGTALCIINFILTIPTLVLTSGWISQKTESVLLQDMGGIWRKSPLIAGVFLLGSLSLVGVPGLCLFPGIFLTISGVLLSQPIWAAVAGFAFLILAAGILWMFQQIFTGKFQLSKNLSIDDSKVYPGRSLIVIAALLIWFGFFPQYMIRSIRQPMAKIHQHIQAHRVFSITKPETSPMELMLRKHRQSKNE